MFNKLCRNKLFLFLKSYFSFLVINVKVTKDLSWPTLGTKVFDLPNRHVYFSFLHKSFMLN